MISGGGSSYLGPNIYIGSFICPDDRNHIDVIGGLSYVANTGYISAETFTKNSNSTYGGIGRSHRPNGQFNDEKYKKKFYTWGGVSSKARINASLASGVFHRAARGTDTTVDPYFSAHPQRMTMGRISRGDGLTQTLMLSENVQAGDWRLGRETNAIAFGLMADATQPLNAAGTLNTKFDPRANGLNMNSITYLEFSRINIGIETSPIGQHPRASGYHAGSVNVFFCGGNGRSISENVDLGVYARLITSDGSSYGQALLGDNEY